MNRTDSPPISRSITLIVAITQLKNIISTIPKMTIKSQGKIWQELGVTRNPGYCYKYGTI